MPQGKTKFSRGSKVAADIVVAVLLAVFAVVFFGVVIGLIGFVILEAAILSVDYLVPDEDDTPGSAVR